MFQRIVVPVDFTPKSARAVRLARRLAGPGGQVTLVHVIERIEHVAPRELKAFYASLQRGAESKLRALAPKSPEVSRLVIVGPRVETILEHVRKTRADLVILGSHRVRRDRGWATISYAVALLAPCPVLLVK